MLPAQRALISVYDKRGLDELARSLSEMGVEILEGRLDPKSFETDKMRIGAQLGLFLVRE